MFPYSNRALSKRSASATMANSQPDPSGAATRGSWRDQRLQRLTQSLFQLPAIGSTDSRPRPVFQDYFKLAMGNWLQAHDAFNIDDCRTMDPHKTNRVQSLGELVQRGTVQQF